MTRLGVGRSGRTKRTKLYVETTAVRPSVCDRVSPTELFLSGGAELRQKGLGDSCPSLGE